MAPLQVCVCGGGGGVEDQSVLCRNRNSRRQKNTQVTIIFRRSDLLVPPTNHSRKWMTKLKSYTQTT
jgi:hypothetical protein